MWVHTLPIRCAVNLSNISGIRCLTTLQAPAVRVGYKWSIPRLQVSVSWFYVNMDLKQWGSSLLTNLYHNCKHCTSNISLTFNISRSLNNEFVWALYLLFIIIRKARFCNLNILSHSKPQHVILNRKLESISESYINFIADRGRYLLCWFIMPNVRKILFGIFNEWELQFMNSFIVSPKIFNSVTLSFTVLLITKRGIPCVGITVWWLWKIMTFVLSTLRESLLTASQSEILDSSRLIKYDIRFTSWFTSWVNAHNMLVNVVSSAYKMKLRCWHTVCISLIYITNNKGPNIGPCGTPVSISFLPKLLHRIQHTGYSQKGNFWTS